MTFFSSSSTTTFFDLAFMYLLLYRYWNTEEVEEERGSDQVL